MVVGDDEEEGPFKRGPALCCCWRFAGEEDVAAERRPFDEDESAPGAAIAEATPAGEEAGENEEKEADAARGEGDR